MIEGVRTKKLRWLPDERGRLMEILRASDEIFRNFAQAYVTSVYPGVVKAWHYHKKQVDNFAVLRGMVKIVLYDDRPGSPTRGELLEFFSGDFNPVLIQVPCGVLHGFKGVGEQEALILNLPTREYDHAEPDEFRIDPHENDIPYDWNRRDG